MLLAHVLNSDATLNSFDVLGTLEFIPGGEYELFIRLYQPQREDELRYIPLTGATLEAYFPQSGGLDALEIAFTSLTDDRSIWHATLSETDTANLLGGNFTFDLVEGAKTTKGLVRGGLALIVTGECC